MTEFILHLLMECMIILMLKKNLILLKEKQSIGDIIIFDDYSD